MSDSQRLVEVERRLSLLKNQYETILPLWNFIDRRKQQLDLEIKLLCDERNELKQGQLTFDEKF